MKSLLHSIMFLLLFNMLQADEYIPSDVQRIINIREAEIKQIDEQYCEALERLKVRYTKKGDLDNALLIDRLIEGTRRRDFSGAWKQKDGSMRIFHRDGRVSGAELDGKRSWRKISENKIEIIQPNGIPPSVWEFDPERNTLKRVDRDYYMIRP